MPWILWTTQAPAGKSMPNCEFSLVGTEMYHNQGKKKGLGTRIWWLADDSIGSQPLTVHILKSVY